MTAKAFLRQYLECERRILCRQRKILHLREQAESLCRALGERVQSAGGGGQRQAELVEAYVDLQRELLGELRRFKEVQKQVLAVLGRLTDSRERDMLERYYIEGMTLNETAEDIGYSYMQITRIHARALESVEKALRACG